VLAFGVLSVSSAGAATWRAGMTINNNSKCELTLVQTYVEQVENFNPAIPHTLAPGKTAAWENCGPGGLGRSFANVLVHEIDCGAAKAVIRRGHWGPDGWRSGVGDAPRSAETAVCT
jgi:hypothetical protein